MKRKQAIFLANQIIDKEKRLFSNRGAYEGEVNRIADELQRDDYNPDELTVGQKVFMGIAFAFILFMGWYILVIPVKPQ